MASAFGWVGLAIVVVLVGVVVALVPYNLRIWRARRAYARMPVEVRRRIRSMLETREPPTVTLSIPASDLRGDAASTKLDGPPDLETDDAWPLEDGKPAVFIAQVRLTHPTLPAAWRGALVVLFASEVDPARLVRSPSSRGPIEEAILVDIPIRIPTEGSLVPSLLTPELDAVLRPYHAATARLLTQVLVDGRHADEVDLADFVLQGRPTFLQGPVEPACPRCASPARFLAQVPDGECVFYVFGCDDHPDRVLVEVQCH